MFELNASYFIDMVTHTREIKIKINKLIEESGDLVVGNDELRDNLIGSFSNFSEASRAIGAELSAMSADKAISRLADPDDDITIRSIERCFEEAEGRLQDELKSIPFVVIYRQNIPAFGNADSIAGWKISEKFPLAARELEEASKCFALGRSTASVFHAMRMLEVGVNKLAEELEIEGPIKPAERNWGIILKKIKEKLDVMYPKKERMPDSKGARLESIFVSLDAVKNPWRNETMHVSDFYQDGEARYILNNVIVYLSKLSEVCDNSHLIEPP